MTKHTSPSPLMLPIREPGTQAIRWLYNVLRTGILDGRFAPGARLPASRDLARHYQLSRGTIVAAFQQLKSEGYLNARVGSPGPVLTRPPPDTSALSALLPSVGELASFCVVSAAWFAIAAFCAAACCSARP